MVAVVWMMAAQSPVQAVVVHKHSGTARVKSHTTAKRSVHKVPGRTTRRKSGHSAHSVRHASTGRISSGSRGAVASRQRRSAIRPEPERVTEIQQALARSGYLKDEPNGLWDERTRDAMRRYQADHGFPATGLPEARSLMKLGLGPHPLPEELDASRAARASADTPMVDPPVPASQQNSPPPGAEP